MSKKSKRIDPRVLRTRQLIRDAFIKVLPLLAQKKITAARIHIAQRGHYAPTHPHLPLRVIKQVFPPTLKSDGQGG